MGKFYRKRTVNKGDMIVDIGLRNGEVNFRIIPPTAAPLSLTWDQVNDLADALDEAIDRQEDDPLL